MCFDDFIEICENNSTRLPTVQGMEKVYGKGILQLCSYRVSTFVISSSSFFVVVLLPSSFFLFFFLAISVFPIECIDPFSTLFLGLIALPVQAQEVTQFSTHTHTHTLCIRTRLKT